MAICNDPAIIVDTMVRAYNDQPRRAMEMLGLWVSELEPEVEYDSVFAAGRTRSTIHYSGRPIYSNRGYWRIALLRWSAANQIVDNEEPYPGDRERAYWRKFCREHGIALS